MPRRGGAGPVLLLVACALAAAAMSSPAQAALDPPFTGTIFLDPDIITATDPTTFASIEPTGQGPRTMYDRRVDEFVTVDAHLFDVQFRDGLDTEVQVNPEFEPSAARALAESYARAVGQLPPVLRRDVHAVWIQGGNEAFGGGNDSLLIHTEQGDDYEAAGILEETLVHEAAHTSLDADHAAAPGWVAAQDADPTYISAYARDNPGREDVAESFLLYLALRYRQDRIDDTLAQTIRATMPNRIAYLDRQGLALGSFAPPLRQRSRGALDGWVRESSAASGVGGQANADGKVLRVGRDAGGREHRAVLSFDTSRLPDRAVITSLTVRLRQSGRGTGDPLLDPADLRVAVARGGFGSPALRPSDFATRATRTVTPGTSTGAGGPIDLDLVGAGPAVSRTGLTQMRLRFAGPREGDEAALLEVASGDALRRVRPILAVQYGSR